MDENALGFASYWRNSLADAESGKGSFERKDAKNFTHWHGIAAGRLDEAIVSKFFEGEKDDVETVDVVLRPKVYFRLLQHGKDRSAGAPDIVTPLVTPALLSREGFLYPTPATSIPRDLLEPLPKGAFSIGEIGQYDKYKTIHTSFSINFDDSIDKTAETDEEREARYAALQQEWRQYLDDSERLLKNVAGDWIKILSNMNSLSTVILLKRRNLVVPVSISFRFMITCLFARRMCRSSIASPRERFMLQSLCWPQEQNSATGLDTPEISFRWQRLSAMP